MQQNMDNEMHVVYKELNKKLNSDLGKQNNKNVIITCTVHVGDYM